jgi:putative ABC transport system permease protein
MNTDPDNSRQRSLSFIGAEFKESFLMAMGAVAAHKLRSALTLLGVLVGVFSIIVVMTTMRAMESEVETEMSDLGGTTFAVQKWPGIYFGGRDGWQKYYRRKNITYAQALTLAKKATMPRSVGIELSLPNGELVSRFAKAPPSVDFFGETPGSFAIRNWVLADGGGRILQDSDVDGAHPVCVLGSALAKKLFPFGSPLDERIKVDGINYTVVGLLDPAGAMSGGDQDNFAVCPITTGLNRYGVRQSLTILVEASDTAAYDDTVDQVRGILRTLRKVDPGADDDFEIVSNDSRMEQINNFTFAVRIGVAAVSSIALLAAGIGIMNIMLVSVTERTREIGVRRAIGARKRNVMTQFILEAIVLCELGGVAGVVLGIVAGDLTAHYLMHLPPVIPYDWVVIGLGICSLVGIVFGTYPAYKAANLDPIESLRYE